MVGITDYLGRLFRKGDTAEPQTATVGHLPETIGGHPSRGLTPGKLARILEDAEQGDLYAQLDLGEDMEEKDGHIFSELSKRRRALLGLPWSIEPPRNASREEERVTDLVREQLAEFDLDDVVLDMADAIGKGFACMEFEGWELEQRVWHPRAITLRPQRWFQISREAHETITLRDGSAEGAALQPFGWITHVHKAKSGHLSRAGLHRILAWPFLFKNYSVRDLAEFLEIYGLPLRLGTYPRGASDKEKATLLRAVLSIGHAAAGIVPEGMAVEFQEAAKGASSPFVAMMDWCERTQSKAILGATLTSQADRGSNTNALGNVHNDVRRDLLISDARQIAATLTRDLLYPMAALNSGTVRNVKRSPRFVYDTREPEDLKLYADALPALVNVGLPIPQRWAHERLQIPEPEDGEPVLARAAPAMPNALLRAGRAALRAGGAEPTSEAQAARLDIEAAPALDAMIDQVRALLDEVATLEELQERLLEVYPQMDSEALGEVIGDALTAGLLAGRSELLDEIDGR